MSRVRKLIFVAAAVTAMLVATMPVGASAQARIARAGIKMTNSQGR